MPPPDPKPLTLGPFALDEPIATGAMGRVWSAHHTPSGLQVAIKVLEARLAGSDLYRAAFRHEVRSLGSLDHPTIVRVYDSGDVSHITAHRSEGRLDAGVPWLAMEYVPGGSLHRLRGLLDWTQQKAVLHRLLQALAHAHARGVIHRDIKPRNVLCAGRADRSKLADFGMAHALWREPVAWQGMFLGTPGYMAPEQFDGAWRKQGPWTDLYALGCLGWAMATGDPPFPGPRSIKAFGDAHRNQPPPSFEPDGGIPREFEGWLRLLLSKKPHQRPGRAAEAAALLDAVDGPSRTVSLPARWAATSTRDRLPSGAGLGVIEVRSLPLVGRKKERDRLWDTLHGALASRRPRALVLRGPAGVGKSRLAAWIGEQAHESGVAELLCATHAPDAAPGQGPGPMVAGHLQLAGLPRDEVSAQLAALGIRDPAAVSAVLPSLRRGRSRRGEGGAEVLRTALGRLPGERALVLWLDDVQWGADSLALACHLMEDGLRGGRQVLIVATVRDDALAERPLEAELVAELLGFEGSVAIDVRPLGLRARKSLVRSLLGLREDVAVRVEERTAGNPQFAVELVADWVRRGLLVPSQEGFVAAAGTDAELPDALHELWADRLDRALIQPSRAVRVGLELAGVLGVHVDPGEWETMCQMAGFDAPWTTIDQLVADGLVLAERSDPRHGWSFAHGMLREVVVDVARLGGRLPLLHRACARMLLDRAGPRSAERRGLHLIEAEDHGLAVEPLLTAAFERQRAGDYRHVRLLLDHREAAMKAAGVPTTDPCRGDGWLLRVRSARKRGALGEADEWLAEGAWRMDAAGWERIGAGVQRERGLLAMLRGDLPAAEKTLRDAESRATRAGDAELVTRCRRNLAFAARSRGDLAGAEAMLRKALTGLHGDVEGLAHCRAALGRALSQRGRQDDAESHLSSAQGEFDALGMRWEVANTMNDRADAFRARDDLDRAEALYRSSLAGFEAIGAVHTVYPTANLGLLLLEAQRPDEARPLLEASLTHFERRGITPMQAAVHVALMATSTADDGAFDHHLAAGRRLLEESGYRDADIARAAEFAAAGARGERRQAALQIAQDQYAALGRAEDVARLNAAFSTR